MATVYTYTGGQILLKKKDEVFLCFYLLFYNKNVEMNFLNNINEKYKDNTVWQFIKFNFVGFSISLVQLILANVLPLLFDNLLVPLPVFLRGIFNPDVLFEGGSIYVKDGAVTWAYVLPFFFSNFLANIYGYFMNMKYVFKGKGTKKIMIAYCVILFALILISTWLQGQIVACLMKGPLNNLARTIAALTAGLFQVLVLFPLEKYVLFKEKDE